MYVRSIRNTQIHANTTYVLNIQTSKEIVNGRPIRIVRIPKPKTAILFINHFTFILFCFVFNVSISYLKYVLKYTTYYFLPTYTSTYIHF